ncbi:MAG: 50S ribosomal protein L25 [bacterium]|jgi:large subunit ribosomal protein L25|nr:50S ribosomal protein L25 [bacterium]
MSDQVVLKAELRSGVGKQVAKRLRAEGRLPAVVYGGNAEALACSVDLRALETVLHTHGRNAIINLDTGDKTQSTIVKDLQQDYMRGKAIHVDFHRIDLTQKIIVEVSVESVGIPTGVRNEGGILEQMLHHLEVECLPTEIPDRILVDVSALSVGDNLHVSDISLDNPGQIIVTDGDRTVFTLASPTVQRDPSAEEEVETFKEPEVIERGKKDDEEA